MNIAQTLHNPLYHNGLALGGGSALGVAHIGVLRAIEEQQVPLHCIAGTSIGALVAAFYAFGKSLAEIEAGGLDMSWQDVRRLKPSKLSLFDNHKLGQLVTEHLGEVNIEDAKIPLAIVAADIATGRTVILRSGPVADAVMASTCLPGLFKPVQIGDNLLVDGGIVENVPISALLELGANSLLAVDLSAQSNYRAPNDIFDVMSNAIAIAINNNTENHTRQADLCIRPNLSAHNSVDTNPEELAAMVEIGYQDARLQLLKTVRFKQWFSLLCRQCWRKISRAGQHRSAEVIIH